MRKFIFILCFLMTNSVILSQPLTLDAIVVGNYNAKNINIPISSSDGNYYYKADDTYARIIKYSYQSGLAVDTLLDLSNLKSDYPIHLFQGFMVDSHEEKIVIFDNAESIYRRSFVADYYIYDITTEKLTKLTDSPTKQATPIFSNDGSMLAYVLANNIYIYHLDTDLTDQVTVDGSVNTIINGATDWVYEEEFATTTTINFSSDDTYLAYIRFDESAVKEFSFQEFKNNLYPVANTFKYPKAGERNSSVTCQIYEIRKKTTNSVDLKTDDVEYIPRIEFLSDSQLAIMTLNRHQNKFRMFLADVSKDCQVSLMFEEANDRYLNYEFLESIRFLDDSFTYISEKDGYSHIYLYSMGGTLIKQLTAGRYDVTSLLSVNQLNTTIYYQAADESPLERTIHKLNYKNGVDRKISKLKGMNYAYFSNNGQFFINNWSDAHTPNIISVLDADGKELRVLENNQALNERLMSSNIPRKEFFKLKADDGTLLNAWMLKPTDFNLNKKYPLLMVQYSGPDSQQVLNQYSIDWVYYLATRGYIIACVDGRGTGARGQDFRKTTYLNLGIQESSDQIFAAKYLGRLPYIDSKNISIWGWSFGGYNVLMSLSRSKNIFKKGIAIAPVTDWRLYDSIYTERYMRTPQENKQGYDNGSPLALASNLSGKLLLIHGSADDNVHYQNSISYISSLISNDKQFDLFIFPDSNHSLSGVKNRKYLYHKIINFLEE